MLPLSVSYVLQVGLPLARQCVGRINHSGLAQAALSVPARALLHAWSRTEMA